MVSSRRQKILALTVLALVLVGFGVWLIKMGYLGLGCLFIAVFGWRVQQFVVWFIAPSKAPEDYHSHPLTSRWQRVLLSIVCLLGAGVCAVGVYLCRLWPEQWQAGFVFILFGLLVLVPVTVTEIRSRRRTAQTSATAQ